MRQFLTIVLAAALIWLGLKFKDYCTRSMADYSVKSDEPVRTAPGKLPGMAPSLEESLEAAKKGGVESLVNWLRQHRTEIEDPRLADIDLDYVVLVGRTDPREAKRVLKLVKDRVPANSPVHTRLEQLEKAYQ